MDQLLHLFDLSRRDLIAIPCAMVWFFGLYKCLKALIFDPYLKLEALRDGATTGAIHDAKVLQDKAHTLDIEIEKQLKAAREQALAQRTHALEFATREADEIQTSSESEVTALEIKEHAALASEKADLEKALVTDSQALAGLVKSRVAELAN